MSARLKLKKLKLQTKYILDNCRLREAEARYEVVRVHKLLHDNTMQIESRVEFYPMNTMRDAVDCLNYNVRAVSDSIVRKYTERLAAYVHDKLREEYMFNKFAVFGVRLTAPALTEDHIEVFIKEITK